jgi:hypothetical protein
VAVSKPDRCTRSLAEQWADVSGAVRRIDHPRGCVAQIDLLSDEALDAYRADHPGPSGDALDAVELLADAMAARAAVEEAARLALEDTTPERPMLGVIACMECGAFEVARIGRPWPIDRAMRRSGLAERDVRTVLRILLEAFDDAQVVALDQLSVSALRELLALDGEDFDLEVVRARYRHVRQVSAEG